MMVEFKWISLFLTAVLQFTAAAGKLPPSFTVRVGDDVTLPCENVIDDQQECEYTTWLFSGSGNTAAVELVKHGQIVENTKSKSDRLSVTENCSLVIKKITVENVGHYDCQQFITKGGQQHGENSQVYLSVINMTEHTDTDKVTLNCSVSTYEHCSHTVKWLYEGKDVDKDNQDLKTSQYSCNASVSFLTSHYIYTSRHNQFSCEVTDGDKVQVFPFRFLPSGEKPDWWWLYIIVTVASVALLIIVVKVIRWKRAKGNKAGMNDNIWLTSDPAVTESAPENTADPENGVTYATVSFTAKTNSEGRVQSKNDADEGDAVTYMTVKASSADPSNLYATIN